MKKILVTVSSDGFDGQKELIDKIEERIRKEFNDSTVLRTNKVADIITERADTLVINLEMFDKNLIDENALNAKWRNVVSPNPGFVFNVGTTFDNELDNLIEGISDFVN